MILKCPNCGDEYEVQAKGNLDRFTMTCPTCGTDITIQDEIKINAVVNKDGVGYVKKEDSHSGRSWKFIVALIVIMGLLAISVPEKSKHFDKLSEFVIKRTKDNSSMDGWFAAGVAHLALGICLEVDDYFFFNIGRIKIDDIDKPITLGLFNHVFILWNPSQYQNTESEEVEDEDNDENYEDNDEEFDCDC